MWCVLQTCQGHRHRIVFFLSPTILFIDSYREEDSNKQETAYRPYLLQKKEKSSKNQSRTIEPLSHADLCLISLFSVTSSWKIDKHNYHIKHMSSCGG